MMSQTVLDKHQQTLLLRNPSHGLDNDDDKCQTKTNTDQDTCNNCQISTTSSRNLKRDEKTNKTQPLNSQLIPHEDVPCMAATDVRRKNKNEEPGTARMHGNVSSDKANSDAMICQFPKLQMNSSETSIPPGICKHLFQTSSMSLPEPDTPVQTEGGSSTSVPSTPGGSSISPRSVVSSSSSVCSNSNEVSTAASSCSPCREPLNAQSKSDLEIDAEPDTPLQTQADPSTPVPSTPEGSSIYLRSEVSSSSSLCSNSDEVSSASSSCSPSIEPSNSQSSLCDNQSKRKRDCIILNASADEEQACDYKTHLESDVIGIKDITVDVFSQIGAGQSECTVLNKLADQYNNILVWMTENLCRCSVTKFHNEMLMTGILKYGDKSAVVPVWTKDSEEFPPKVVPLEILSMTGLKFFQFENEKLRKYYIANVQTLVKKGRNG